MVRVCVALSWRMYQNTLTLLFFLPEQEQQQQMNCIIPMPGSFGFVSSSVHLLEGILSVAAFIWLSAVPFVLHKRTASRAPNHASATSTPDAAEASPRVPHPLNRARPPSALAFRHCVADKPRQQAVTPRRGRHLHRDLPVWDRERTLASHGPSPVFLSTAAD